jgi:hypothetical protein
MPESRVFLRHDLTALFAFIDSISGICLSRSPIVAYTPAADRFFDFISRLALTTKTHLAGWFLQDDEEFEERRQELETIRSFWKELHNFIKPTLDADTLHIPSAVVDGIVRRFREIPKYSRMDFSIFLTAEFNYVQVRSADFRLLSSKIRSIISGAPEFPPNLGIIGIPYSQGSTVFPNCLVAHEIGHFVYRETNRGDFIRAEAAVAIRSRFANGSFESDPDRTDRRVKTVSDWAEEIFCDLFGVMLLGPCYTYAYIEAFDLSSVLDVNGELSIERSDSRLGFHASYPSHLFRIHQQAILLRESSWWPRIERATNRYSVLVRKVLEIPMDKYLTDGTKEIVLALLDIVPEVRAAIGEVFTGIDEGYSSFAQINDAVQEYLGHGVVPSSVNISMSRSSGETTVVHPTPVVLLNSGMEFYLTRIDDLIHAIPSEDVNSYDRRLHWIRRVEEWIAKAIEDEYLMRRQSDVGIISGND